MLRSDYSRRPMKRAIIITAALLGLAACGGGDDSSEAGAATSTTATTERPSTTTTTPTTTTEPATTTTTEVDPDEYFASIDQAAAVAQCTYGWEDSAARSAGVDSIDFNRICGELVPPTTFAPPTTLDPAIQGDLDIAVAFADMAVDRTKIADALEGLSSVESVDLVDATIEEGGTTGVFRIALTSGYNGIEYRDEIAWSVARVLDGFWAADGKLRNDAGAIKTRLELTVDDTVYIAPYELMVAVGDLSTTSTDWLNASRQG